MPEYVIRIPVDPANQPPQIANNGELSPSSNVSQFDKGLTTRGLIKGAVIIGSLKSVGTTAIGTVGDLTGSGRFQRNLDITKQLFSYGSAFAIFGPIGGLAVAGAQALSEVITETVEARNVRIDAGYQRSVSGRRLGNR